MFLIGGGDIIVQLLRRSRLVRRRFVARTMPLAESPLNGGLPVANISAAYFFLASRRGYAPTAALDEGTMIQAMARMKNPTIAWRFGDG